MLRAVLCGCGAMAKGWLKAVAETPGLSRSVAIVGLVDLNPDTAKALADEFGLIDVTLGTDLADVLAATGADVVFDVVVPAARASVVSTALAHGCHVLSEKPMATSLSEGQILIEKARAANRIHAIVQNRRYIEGVRSIASFLKSGAIGSLTSLNCDFFIGAHFGGFREDMDNVLLLDMAIHTFDAARFMSGKVPLGVYCHENNPQGSWYRTGASANAIFEFSDNVTFNYRGSWCAEGANTSWESSWRIVGTKGTLLWDGADRFEAHQVSGEGGFFRPLSPVPVPLVTEKTLISGHASVIASFVDAIRTGRKPETDGTDNIKSLAMVFGAIESARTKAHVTIAA